MTFLIGFCYFSISLISLIKYYPLFQLECVRALYYKCIDDYIAGEDITPLATMLKLKSARLARQLTDGCLQFWGGNEYCLHFLS